MEISTDYQKSLDYAISYLNKSSVFFGEVRYTKHLELKVIARDSKISEIKRSLDQGIGIRVQNSKGAPLTFVSSSNLEKNSIQNIIDEAIKSSKVLDNFSSEKRTYLAEQPTLNKKVFHDSKDSVFDTDLSELKDYALNHASVIKEQGVSSASCGLAGVNQFKHIVNTEGTDIQFFVDGVGYKGDATLRGMGKFKTYSERQGGTFGLKDLLALLEKREFAQEVGSTVKLMAGGKDIDSGTYDVVIDPAFAGLLAHESFGHMTEADAITNSESALTDRLGEELAPDYVSIIDDPTFDQGAWNLVDDEGVMGNRNQILDKGVLRNFMSDRANAYQLGTVSTGNSRAMDYSHPPIVRMTNTCFLAGDHSFDEIIEDVQHGIFLKGHAGGESGNTGKFSFRSQVGYLIENGKLTDVISSVTLNGNILEYLNKIDAVGKDFDLTVDCGFGGCGKGGQRALVGLGGTYLRFRNVAVTAIKRKMPKMPKMGKR
ncbi:MAG: TldD/PmbA family protein [Candidatus Hodarchaeales archaeon]